VAFQLPKESGAVLRLSWPFFDPCSAQRGKAYPLGRICQGF